MTQVPFSFIGPEITSGGLSTAPANTVAPAVTGTTTVGSVLTCSTGTWSENGGGTIAYAYQWYRAGTSLSGETDSSYTLLDADLGNSLYCRVSATNTGGADTANSNSVAIPGGNGGLTDLSLLPKATRTVEPTLDFVTLDEAKAHLSISSSDTSHDSRLALLIDTARDQLEEDTGVYIAEQTWELKLPYFYEMRFSQTPVMSVESIYYFDSSNASTQFTDFALDTARNYLVLNSTPTTYERFDAVTITYKVGQTNSASGVRAIVKHAVLLLIGHYFENPDMLVGLNVSSMHAYEQLVKKLQRSTYP